MARSRRLSDFAVGLFVLAAMAILVAGSLWIAGSGAFVGEPRHYRVVLDNSAGVQPGDRVRVAGVAVGRIQSLELRPEQERPVELGVSIDAQVPLHQDARALIATTGLLGTNYVEIVPGSVDSPLLEPGGTIRGQAGAAGLEAALSNVDAISDRLVRVMDQTSALLEQMSGELGPIMSQLGALLSEENVEEMEAILASTRSTLDEVAPRVGPLLDQMETLSRTAEASLEGMPELTEKLSLLTDDLSAALGPDGQRMAELLDSARGTLGSSDAALAVLLDNRSRIEATLRDLQTAVANFEVFSQRIRQQPSSLLRSAPAPERRPGELPKGERR